MEINIKNPAGIPANTTMDGEIYVDSEGDALLKISGSSHLEKPPEGTTFFIVLENGALHPANNTEIMKPCSAKLEVTLKQD